MPQVDPVTFLPKKGEKGGVKQLSNRCFLISDEMDHSCKKQTQKKHPSLIEKISLAIDSKKHNANGYDKEGEEQAGFLTLYRKADLLVLLSDGTQKNADQKRECHRVGPIVNP